MKNMRPLLFAILMVLISSPLISQETVTRNSNIKSIVVTTEKFDMLVKKKYKDSETYYDQKGNLIEEISYKQGKIHKHFKYQYDAEGNKIREEEFDPSGRLVEWSVYRFESGLRVEKTVYDAANEIKSKKYYTYTTY